MDTMNTRVIQDYLILSNKLWTFSYQQNFFTIWQTFRVSENLSTNKNNSVIANKYVWDNVKSISIHLLFFIKFNTKSHVPLFCSRMYPNAHNQITIARF